MPDASPPRTFDDMYEGRPPWDIGRPQPEVVRLADQGRFEGRLLDVGCGTGENVLFLAARGHEVVGVDLSPRAVRRAEGKARERNSAARFYVIDALTMRPEDVDGPFDGALDSGVFHVFDDADRARYVEALHRMLRPGGRLHLIVFSDQEPIDWGGPRRITAAELRAAFQEGWELEELVPTRFGTLLPEVHGHAWRATLRRV